MLQATGGDSPQSVHDLAVGPDGDLTLSDFDGDALWRLTRDGKKARVAGGLDDGDGGMAIDGRIAGPNGLAIAADGTIYVAAWGNDSVRAIDPSGRIRTVVGAAGPGFSGDGFPAGLGQTSGPAGLGLGDDGALFIADLGNGRVRKVDENGVLSTVAGGGARTGARVSAKSAELSQPIGVAAGPDGATWITDATARVDPTGAIFAIAGTGARKHEKAA